MINKMYTQKSTCNSKIVSSLCKYECSVAKCIINKTTTFTYSSALYKKKFSFLGKHSFYNSHIGMQSK